MNDSLVLNNKTFSYQQIAQHQFKEESLSAFEFHTLEFCAAWLNGTQEFELQTSGSTGMPKRISISRKQMEASAALTLQRLGLKKGERALVCIDTRFIGGKMMLVRSLEAGMQMTIVTPVSNPLISLPGDSHFDFAALVPMQLQLMLERAGGEKKILDQMKAIIVGGGTVNKQLEAAIQELKSPVYSTYGMTETVSHIALRKINTTERSEHYETLPGVEIGTDARGCLSIQGPMTNGETVITNDLVTLVGKSGFRWEGRIDHVINSGGIKINIEKLENEVEEVFLKLGLQNRFILAGIADELLYEKLVLIIEGNAFQESQESLLMQELKKTFAPYHVPKAVFYLPRLVETSTGKIQRKKNIERLLNSR